MTDREQVSSGHWSELSRTQAHRTLAPPEEVAAQVVTSVVQRQGAGRSGDLVEGIGSRVCSKQSCGCLKPRGGSLKARRSPPHSCTLVIITSFWLLGLTWGFPPF